MLAAGWIWRLAVNQIRLRPSLNRVSPVPPPGRQTDRLFLGSRVSKRKELLTEWTAFCQKRFIYLQPPLLHSLSSTSRSNWKSKMFHVATFVFFLSHTSSNAERLAFRDKTHGIWETFNIYTNNKYLLLPRKQLWKSWMVLCCNLQSLIIFPWDCGWVNLLNVINNL